MGKRDVARFKLKDGYHILRKAPGSKNEPSQITPITSFQLPT